MRTDLSFRASDGRLVDLAVFAPPGARLADVAGHLRAHLGARHGPDRVWSGRRRLDPQAELGRAPLVHGTVLDTGPLEPVVDDTGIRVEVVGGAGAGTARMIGTSVCTIGRSRECELVLPDSRASRQHAEVRVRNGRITVRDLGSTPGTLVDGEPVIGTAPVGPGAVIEIGDSFLSVTVTDDPAATVRSGPDGTVLVDRPPRRKHIEPPGRFTIPAAPGDEPLTRLSWAAALIPALVGVVLAWALHSPQLLVFLALTPLGLLVTSVADRSHRRRARHRAAAAHRAATDRLCADIDAAVADEVALRRMRSPDPAQLARIATIPTRRLWERRRADADLLQVRLGLGRPPSAILVERAGASEPAARLPPVPCGVDLRAGALGVAAPVALRRGLGRWLVAQLAALAAPGDLEFALLVDCPAQWEWARWLPHLRTRVADSPTEQVRLVRELTGLVESRLRSRSGQTGWTEGWLVLVIDLARPPDEIVDLNGLLARGAPVGLTAVCFGERPGDLPDACAVMARAGDSGSARLRLEASTVVADQVSTEWAERVARGLAPFRDAQGRAETLPEQCRLLDLLGLDRPGVVDVQARWQAGDGRPSTVLGVGRDGPVRVDLARDGPHALVAGTTGSGKSELLRTLVAGLAASHPPSEVSFLLVDYKGGAAFAECAVLPHVLGIVTDLDAHLTGRVLASLDSELRHRERRFADVGAADLDDYRATGQTLARLIIVVDEFATLADELPGFISALVAIAQRGRSLGLHLVLGTQRPGGAVSPEIRANTSLRIALRTTSPGESADVVAIPDAALIDHRTPGRAYVRIGSTTAAMQAARIGGVAPVSAGRIRVEPLDRWRRPPDPTAVSTAPTDLALLVRACCAAASGSAAPRRPWLPPLPDRLAAVGDQAGSTAGSTTGSTARSVSIGRLDLPAQQRQPDLYVDLHTAGGILIVGGPRSGRTTTLLTLAHAATRAAPADQLHLHAVDATGAGLRPLRGLPHAGTVTTTDDDFELTARLCRRLSVELARRRDRPAPERTPAALLLLLDGWENLLAESEQFDGGRTIDVLIGLLRDAPAAGATIALTGGRSALAPRLTALTATKLVLALPDLGDYAQAGVAARAIPGSRTPGRGVRAGDDAEFQIALPPEPVRDVAAARGAIRLRPLPRRITLGQIPRPVGRYLLAVGGAAATPIAVDLSAGAGRMLVAGPPRSGRSSVLRTVLAQADSTATVAAPPRSPLVASARARGLAVIGPQDRTIDLPESGLVLVDDAEAFVDTDVGAALTSWLRAESAGRVAVVAARSDAAGAVFRGLVGEVRRAGCGLLLQPAPHDGELLGVTLARVPRTTIAGRGVLVPDPDWRVAGDDGGSEMDGGGPFAVQAVLPDEAERGRAAQPMCG
jgi:S-DNA-T family DNA segregation ATPase FtsK/SpoIIIE